MPFSCSASLRRDAMDVVARAVLTLGPFDVSTDRISVARYAAATRSAPSRVPTTFPTVWLTHPMVRAAVESLAKPGEVAFHEEQTFEYTAPLVPDAAYDLFAEIDRRDTPARVVVASRIEQGGAVVLTMRTVLRLVDTSAAIARADRARVAQQ